MIPKKIHYCWFGKAEKPKNVKKCIASWREKLIGYEIIEWNESNFHVDGCPYTAEAYRAGKYAFVSDVARLQALYEYGGIYLDTDVMVYRDFDAILNQECVLGFEEKQYIATSFMACQPQNPFIGEFIGYYQTAVFGDFKTNVQVITELLEAKGLRRDNMRQVLDGKILVLPQEYFSPYDYINCKMNKTEHTICAHLYFVSWAKRREKINRVVKAVLVRLIGVKGLVGLRGILRKDVT